MPISIVVGGQFGSEGKGKVALELSRRAKETNVTVIRIGGPNSGHTGYSKKGKKFLLRQMPAGCIDKNVDVVFPAGFYIDPEVLEQEISELDYPRDRIFISKHARIITEAHKKWENASGLVGSIGSTGSGVGAAVMAAVARNSVNFPLGSPDAEHHAPLSPYICDSTYHLAAKLSAGHRLIIEGTQGFGLSLLDGGYWPKATARSTTAAGALADTGLSPLDVDDVTLVLRAYPIRVAGNSGPLTGETTWPVIARNAGIDHDIQEYTTVTNKLRRVGVFDPELVCRAIQANKPSRIVLNHLDYVGAERDLHKDGSPVAVFLNRVEKDIETSIDWLGFSGRTVSINENLGTAKA